MEELYYIRFKGYTPVRCACVCEHTKDVISITTVHQREIRNSNENVFQN